MVYELICEGSCNPNLDVVDKLASQYMSHRYIDTNGRVRPDDLVRLQRTLKYTPHVEDSYDHRFAICGICAKRRKF